MSSTPDNDMPTSEAKPKQPIWAIILLGALIGLICLYFFLPHLPDERVLTKKVVSAARMKGIMIAMVTYDKEWAGQRLENLDVLVQEGLLPPRAFKNPCRVNVDYYFIVHPDDNRDPNRPIMFDPAENHGGEGGIVALGDTHVEYISNPR